MKKKVLIIALLAIAQLCAFYLKSHAQYGVQNLKYPSDIPIKTQHLDNVLDDAAPDKSKQLIADETTLIETKTGAKIECSNDKVHFKLYEKWQHAFTKYSWTWKKDRHGAYKQYSITVSRKDADLIREWAKSNL